MGDIFNNLKDSNQVIVSTDKTNSFRSVAMKECMTMVDEHLVNLVKEIERYKVREILDKAIELMDEIFFR